MDEGKRFSLEEAGGLIPQMELVVEKMQRIGMRVREEMGTLSEDQRSPVQAQHVLQLRPLFEDMAQAVQGIEQLGGCSKDWSWTWLTSMLVLMGRTSICAGNMEKRRFILLQTG